MIGCEIMISATLSPTLLFLSGLEFLVIPLTILVVGFIMFYFKPKHRRLIGSVLIVLGVLDMSVVLLRYPFIIVSFAVFIDFIIILLGGVSVFYSLDRASKN
jgi:hypothetical protein